MRELTSWSAGVADPGAFPYDPVVDAFHRVGKHFVDKELLARLDEARARVAGHDERARLLRDFLDVALDKWDGRYDYRSYLALRLLRLPDGTDDPPPVGGGDARRVRDRLVVRLVADAVTFELASAAKVTGLLPEQRPGRAVVAKRCRLGVRAAMPALARLGLTETIDDATPATAATALATVAAGLDTTGDPPLRLSMLPVHVTHDEYLFIRVLQAYECVFAGVADELRAVVVALHTGSPAPAVDRLGYARELLGTAGSLFSLLATMQPAAFQTFRQYTEGASAIQSRSYKLVESLCRTPAPQRLDSVAYRSVPEVRARVRDGQPTVDEAYRRAVHEGRLAEPARRMVAAGMGRFAEALAQWRRTHYGVAVRMLGRRPGTGYTEGTPYLAAVRDLPVFDAVDPYPPRPTGDRPE
ncbi:tryptophan 2,3-dioxygenase family protein [Micromonospora craniellae]|uniref:tryptophan 2,3-dioxygenase family protein n=1 Tax=Micromonospora craniellae TaxID=2294034 RepID=UPI001CC46A26|nr:tryptophan 2,3-dioxygenase family protein [Micromonospora craniellae]